MRRILIRSGISPLDNFDAAHMILKNSIGGNVGNLVYAYSVYRTLMTKNTVITPDYYKIDHTKADEINKKYDCYIIPLADAFRKDFVPNLRKYTKLIKKLKIPVIVIGAGLRAPFEPNLKEGFSFDEDVKAFVKAVLEKSSIIGLRGQITSDYLTRLGFKEGVDHTVIGCPSMYAFGRELNIRKTKITKNSLVSVNSSKLSPKNVLDFITRGMEEYPNHYFIPQWMKEFKLTYLGHPSIDDKVVHNYPTKMSDAIYQEDRVRYFLSAPKWIEFLKQVDLSFGARLHGNITATIAGTPSILITKDARMRELAEYHQLTSITKDDIKENTKLSDVIQQVDFHRPEKRQAENFDHYIDFLNKNNLDHIYKKKMKPKQVPLDKELKKIKLREPIKTISGISTKEMAERWEAYYPSVAKKEAAAKKKQKETLAKKDKEIKTQKDKIAELEKRLEHTMKDSEGTLPVSDETILDYQKLLIAKDKIITAQQEQLQHNKRNKQ